MRGTATREPTRAPGSYLQLIAGALDIVGVGFVTGIYYVPLNNILDSLDPNSAEGMAYWAV